MSVTSTKTQIAAASILTLFDQVRQNTTDLVAPLSGEDMMLQSMTDASPAKWHIAHTTWFFEEFILKIKVEDYTSPDDRFAFLFNSYYVQAGPRHARDKRGLISRPNVQDVLAYRSFVEDSLRSLLINSSGADYEEIADLVELGCHHEMQHQELLVTDLLHGLSYNPLMVAYKDPEPMSVSQEVPLTFTGYKGGLVEIGHAGEEFSYDCETPRHQTFIAPFELADRPVSNRDWIAFMEGGGYQDATLWLMDGWARCQKEEWDAPLYWWKQDDEWWTYTLRGAQPVNLDAPVVHVSYYEADAFARWSDMRLPTEAEWEHAADGVSIEGNFLESGTLRPQPGGGLYGDVWEWTQSPFTPYPGFKPPKGAIGEYNGKFMINQMVLRGGSCATPKEQMRQSYRTFFYPHHRWQMLGLRLAKDVSNG